MLKKILVLIAVLSISLLFMIPSDATPSDVMLDQQVELMIPGSFELVDTNNDRKVEVVRFTMAMKAYQEGQFIVTGNLEGMKNGNWQALATTAAPIDWSPENNRITLDFHPGEIGKLKISGPYRVSIALKKDDWQLESQIAGFSPKYKWSIFNGEAGVAGEISTSAMAKETAETWAQYNKIKLGKLLKIIYNYDHWQVDYNGGLGSKVLRFLVSPSGAVKLMKITAKDV